ncbi:MAG: sigma factor [Terrimicrobiaceae bacterium]
MSCDEDDGTLCEKARSGYDQAFAALFHRHYDGVHAFVFRIFLDATGAEDITQEAFIKAARTLPSFRRQASPVHPKR